VDRLSFDSEKPGVDLLTIWFWVNSAPQKEKGGTRGSAFLDFKLS
jgi:hypothetical protein